MPAPEPGPTRSGRRFGWALVGLAVLGVLVRLVFALAVAPDLPPPGDADVFREMARNLADGHGLSTVAVNDPHLQPSAEHPPAFPALLALLDVVGLDGKGDQRAALCLIGSLGVVLVGCVGRRVGGEVTGVVAAAVAAVHPLWVQASGLIMSESLHLVLVPAVLLLGLHVLARPTPRGALALGGLIGVAGLVRPEALALAAVVGLPAVLAAVGWTARLRGVALLGLGVLVVVTPWLVRNQHELGTATMSTNLGKTILGSNCDAAYAGPGLGALDYDCYFGAATALVRYGPPGGGPWNGADFDREMGDAGWTFIREHRRQVPKVVAARVARMWGLAFGGDQLDADVHEGPDRGWQRAGRALHLGLLPLAVAGAVVLWRRPGSRRVLVLLTGPVVLVTATTVLIYGSTRMRTGAEPSLAVLAGVAIGTIWSDRDRPAGAREGVGAAVA